MSWPGRLEKSKVGTKWFEELVHQHPDEYGLAITGVENLRRIGKFDELVKTLDRDDDRNKVLIYFPDYMGIMSEQSAFFEVKNGYTIERAAYEAYSLINETKCPVMLIIVWNTGDELQLIKVPVKDLRLVALNPDSDNNKIEFEGETYLIPIKGRYFKCPRELPVEVYAEWKRQHPNASGTDYGAIDFESSEKIILDKKEIK